MSYIKLVNGIPQLEKVRRENGISIHSPEISRTYYIHFANTRERDDWYHAVSTNIEAIRRAGGVIEDMISKVAAMAHAPLFGHIYIIYLLSSYPLPPRKCTRDD